MKKILSALLGLLVASSASAQTTESSAINNLMGLGMPAALAEEVADLVTGDAVFANNQYIRFRNAAGSANIDVLKVDGSDDLIINSDASDSIKLQIGSDAQRLFTFDASSDTAQTLTFGDGGTTAAQSLSISASTADADDDSDICITGGGACTAAGTVTRGAKLILAGNEDATIAAETYLEGNGLIRVRSASANIDLRSSSLLVGAADGTSRATLDGTGLALAGTMTSSRTTDLGWAVVAGANTACNTTCTSACVFGVNTAATEADIVGCADATADECLCAGAS